MNDREWKNMQEELQSLQPGHEEAPQDAYRFKQRVLAEYERRTRREGRAKWTRRAATALTVSAAVCAGLFVASPLTQDGGVLTGLFLPRQAAEQGVTEQATDRAATGNVVRVRIGDNTYRIDLQQRRIEVDKTQPATIQQVKYEARLPVAPSGGLAVTAQLPPEVAIPQEKRIDPQREIGLYVLNGSVESFTFGLQDLNLQLHSEPGRVQVLAIPLSLLSLYEGASVEVNSYGEEGQHLSSQVMKIPAGDRR